MPDAKPTAELRVLLNVLDCAFNKKSWHGPNLMSALRGIDPATAARRIHGRKCIWEQVLHATYWKHAAANKLAGTTPFPHRGSNWPKPPEKADAKSWKEDVALLSATQQRLRDAVAGLSRKELDEKTIWLIHGAAAHDLYHTGQIRLLRRMAK